MDELIQATIRRESDSRPLLIIEGATVQAIHAELTRRFPEAAGLTSEELAPYEASTSVLQAVKTVAVAGLLIEVEVVLDFDDGFGDFDPFGTLAARPPVIQA